MFDLFGDFFLIVFCSNLICFVSPLIDIRWNVGAPGVSSRLQVADHKEHPPDVSGRPGVQHLPMAWAAEAPTPDVDLRCSHGGRLVCIILYHFFFSYKCTYICCKRWLIVYWIELRNSSWFSVCTEIFHSNFIKLEFGMSIFCTHNFSCIAKMYITKDFHILDMTFVYGTID